MSQLPILLAAVVVYTLDPVGVPVAMAAIVGGHFLPYAWVHKSSLYIIMGIVVTGAPFFLYVLGNIYLYLTGFVVGGASFISSLVLKKRAERELSRA